MRRPEISPIGNDTTYLSVVDREGNMVSLIQSNYAIWFGVIVAPELASRCKIAARCSALDAESPNALAGHKRPLHTIIPGLQQKGDIRIAFGIMGGWNQSQAHAQFISNVADFGMNIQAAMEAPRFTKRTFAGCDVKMEEPLPPKSPRRVRRPRATRSTSSAPFPRTVG